MKIAFARNKRSDVNRRAFLRGAGTLAVGLPFLESMPWRSAWAQSAEPTFSFFLCHSCGVVQKTFWPSSEPGAITKDDLAAQERAVSKLADHADRLLLVNGIHFPANNSGCGHAQGLCQVLTGAASNGGGGNSAKSSAPSVDTLIADAVNPQGVEPLALYAGLKVGYINERLSFVSAGQVRSAESNPYNVYKDLMGLAGSSPAVSQPTDPMDMQPIVDELAVRRTSVNDLVREEIKSLQMQSVLSQADRDRLDRHLEGIRDIETNMAATAIVYGCDPSALVEGDFEAVNQSFKANGSQEAVSLLHMQLVAFAFACNLNRTATLQVGDGTDATVYDVPSNSRRWGFHFVSHRTQSDGAVGNDSTAEAAHTEIDALRMETFKKGIDIFASYGTATGNLLDNSVMCWTNAIADGPSHNYNGVPYLIAGSGGGLLKQGQYVNMNPGGGGGGFGGGGGGETNDKVLNALKTAGGLASEDMLADMLKA